MADAREYPTICAISRCTGISYYSRASADGTNKLDYMSCSFAIVESNGASQTRPLPAVTQYIYIYIYIYIQNNFKASMIHTLVIQVLSLWHQTPEEEILLKTKTTRSAELQ
jgi:hypothetical protein